MSGDDVWCPTCKQPHAACMVPPPASRATTPLTHGTESNTTGPGTTRCGLAFSPGVRIEVVLAAWTRDDLIRLRPNPPPCPTCFPVADDNAALRGLAEARACSAAIERERAARQSGPPGTRLRLTPAVRFQVGAHLRDALAEVDRLRAENEGLRARIGRTDITRDAYETLIADDGVWLLEQPRTPERDHILAVLTWSIQALYGKARVPTLPTDRSES